MKTTKPGKQRKRLYQAPLNERYKRFSAPLSSKLKESHSTNSVPVRKGDTVMIMRGDRKGSEGKVTQINRKKYRIFVEGATREKVDGTTTFIPIHPSKVMITRLNLDDKWRKKILERKGVTEKAEIAEEEPQKKEVKKKRKTSKRTKKSGGT
jgi:large subunit ribosomal protein L24